MADRAKRRSVSQKVGRVGQQIFERWATENGLTANESEEDFGIDYFCQQLKPISRRVEEITGVLLSVQVRATSRPSRPGVVVSREDVETALRVRTPFCLVAISLDPEQIWFRFLDEALLEEWTSFLKSNKRSHTHYIQHMHSGAGAFAQALARIAQPGFQHLFEEAKAQARLAAAVPGAVLEVRGGARGFTLVSVPTLSAIFHLADARSRDDAMEILFTPQPFDEGFHAALKKFSVHESLRSAAELTCGRMMVMGPAESAVRLFVEWQGQRAEAEFLERRVGDVRAYASRSGLVIQISDRCEDTGSGQFHHHCTYSVVAAGARDLASSEDLPFLRLLHPGAQFNEVGRGGITIETFDAQMIGAAVAALERVFAALAIPLGEAYLADFNDPSFSLKVGFLDAVLDRTSAAPVIPTFIIGVPESIALDERQWRPATYRVPLVLNLKKRGVVVWVEGEAEGYLYQQAIYGFRFNTSTLVGSEASFPEHPRVNGIEAWIYEDWPPLPVGDQKPRSFSARNEGPLPFAGTFWMASEPVRAVS